MGFWIFKSDEEKKIEFLKKVIEKGEEIKAIKFSLKELKEVSAKIKSKISGFGDNRTIQYYLEIIEKIIEKTEDMGKKLAGTYNVLIIKKDFKLAIQGFSNIFNSAKDIPILCDKLLEINNIQKEVIIIRNLSSKIIRNIEIVTKGKLKGEDLIKEFKREVFRLGRMAIEEEGIGEKYPDKKAA